MGVFCQQVVGFCLAIWVYAGAILFIGSFFCILLSIFGPGLIKSYTYVLVMFAPATQCKTQCFASTFAQKHLPRAPFHES